MSNLDFNKYEFVSQEFGNINGICKTKYNQRYLDIRRSYLRNCFECRDAVLNINYLITNLNKSFNTLDLCSKKKQSLQYEVDNLLNQYNIELDKRNKLKKFFGIFTKEAISINNKYIEKKKELGKYTEKELQLYADFISIQGCIKEEYESITGGFKYNSKQALEILYKNNIIKYKKNYIEYNYECDYECDYDSIELGESYDDYYDELSYVDVD